MSGFHRQRLQQLRSAAGLGTPARTRAAIMYLKPVAADPMPSYYVPGMRLPGDSEAAYIDARYFSPEARHWMREVSRYRAQGGTLSVDDEECFDRVLSAMFDRRKPTAGQQRRFDRGRQLRHLDGLMPVLLEREMRSRGEYYGPDAELAEDHLLPSARELLFRYIADEWNITPSAAKTAFYRWRREADGAQ